MSDATLIIGSDVQRIAAISDYTNGRIGKIIAIDGEAKRYRVQWFREPNGRAIRPDEQGRPRGLKTWVKFDAVLAI